VGAAPHIVAKFNNRRWTKFNCSDFDLVRPCDKMDTEMTVE